MREALIAMEVEGRVEIRGGAGVFVIERCQDSNGNNGAGNTAMPMPGPFEVLFARELIEPDIAALAAKNASSEQVAAMARALGDMVCCSVADPLRLEYDRRFHYALAEASCNSALVLAFVALWAPREDAVYLRLEDHFHTEAVWQRSIIEHREILEAIKSCDAKLARAAMHRHLKNARTRFVSNWQEDGLTGQAGSPRRQPS